MIAVTGRQVRCLLARRSTVTLAAVLSGCVALTGCQGVLDLPLPGGAARGSDVYRVTVEFRDVLDLVPQSAVKVNDVTVGAVEQVRLDGWHAEVRVRLPDSVRLPDNAVAELRQTSLLGEKFVSLSAPTAEVAHGRLGEGDVIPLARSGRNAEVEEVLGALSLLLNGGGVAQLKTISVELSKAMQGRESDVRSVVRQLDTFIGGLDDQKADIVRALDGVDRLSSTLASQRGEVATAIDGLGPGLRVLADQRRALTRMLGALSDLGRVGSRVVRASRADTVADLRALQPTLARLAQAGADLPQALEMAFTYPFPAAATGAVQGDYTNLRITADLDLRGILANVKPRQAPLSSLPSLPTLPGLPALPGLPTALPTGLPTALPTALPTVLPSLPGLPASRLARLGPPPLDAAYDLNLAALLMGGYS